MTYGISSPNTKWQVPVAASDLLLIIRSFLSDLRSASAATAQPPAHPTAALHHFNSETRGFPVTMCRSYMHHGQPHCLFHFYQQILAEFRLTKASNSNDLLLFLEAILLIVTFAPLTHSSTTGRECISFFRMRYLAALGMEEICKLETSLNLQT